MRRCIVPGCRLVARLKDKTLCQKHYQRWYRLENKSDSLLDDIPRIIDTRVGGPEPLPIGTRKEYPNYISLKVSPNHVAVKNRKTVPSHGAWVPEHIVIACEMLGRPLKSYESVHHKDGNRKNNSTDNIQIGLKRERHCRTCTCREAPSTS
jgi:hypothetical protein